MVNWNRDILIATLAEVDRFLEVRPEGQVLDKDLQVLEKKGICWILLCLAAPFYRFFGIDPFSHVRVHQVADKILSLCQQHAARFQERPILINMIREKIIDRLNDRTKGKYQEALKGVGRQLEQLNPLQILPDYLNRVAGHFQPDQLQPGPLQPFFNVALPKLRDNPRECRLEFRKTGPKGNRDRRLLLVQIERNWAKQTQKTIAPSPQIGFSIHIETSSSGVIRSIIALNKNLIAKGSSGNIRSCEELLSNQLLARKQIRELIHEDVLRHFQQMSPRGIVPVLGFRVAPQDNQQTKVQVFEPFCKGGSLAQREGASESVAVKKGWIEDLLYGLAFVHHQSYPKTTQLGVEIDGFHLVHGLISPNHILVHSKEDGTSMAAMTDFSMVVPVLCMDFFGFSSPEKASVVFSSFKEMVNFYKQRGQSSDVWSMGLVFSVILAGSSKKRANAYCFAPLSCIRDRLETCIEGSFDSRESFLKVALGEQRAVLQALTQEALDADLQELKERTLKEAGADDQEPLNHLWDIVGGMLQIDPQKRLTAAQALERFNKAFSL